MKEKLFQDINDIVKSAKLENDIIYNICDDNEKLRLFDEYKDKNVFSLKAFKNYILLRYTTRKTADDIVELRFVSNKILDDVKKHMKKVRYKLSEPYIQIRVSEANEILALSKEIAETFKELFLDYIGKEQSFGCCSKYEECSDSKKCLQKNIRLKYGCAYKKNLESNKIFYGKNKTL